MSKVRNKPCELGKALGKNMAKFADHAEQEWREQMGFIPLRCLSCAFRAGTFANGCLTTQADANKCVLERIPFFCHHKSNGFVNLSICAGYLLLAGKESEPVKVPWEFSQ